VEPQPVLVRHRHVGPASPCSAALLRQAEPANTGKPSSRRDRKGRWIV
jgi:hypothetical protein